MNLLGEMPAHTDGVLRVSMNRAHADAARELVSSVNLAAAEARLPG